MDMKSILNVTGLCLSECELVYRTGRSVEELAALARLHAEAYLEDMRDEKSCAPLREAFREHRRESRRFPTPRDILERLPHLREGAAARPEQPRGSITPGLGGTVLAALNGDTRAMARLEAMGWQNAWWPEKNGAGRMAEALGEKQRGEQP